MNQFGLVEPEEVMAKECDLVVIGAGTATMTAATRVRLPERALLTTAGSGGPVTTG